MERVFFGGVDPARAEVAEAALFVRCPACVAEFKSHGAVLMHLHLKHGFTSRVREVVDGVHCAACLGHYHTAKRLLEHLHKSPVCYDLLKGWNDGVAGRVRAAGLDAVGEEPGD